MTKLYLIIIIEVYTLLIKIKLILSSVKITRKDLISSKPKKFIRQIPDPQIGITD